MNLVDRIKQSFLQSKSSIRSAKRQLEQSYEWLEADKAHLMELGIDPSSLEQEGDEAPDFSFSNPREAS